MKLKTVECCEYKSIRNSNCFDIGEVTCLVGKNEAGKTALLQAIYRLNPIIPKDGHFDVTDDYPRSDVADYEQAVNLKKRSHATVIRAVFSLTDDDCVAVKDAFGDIFKTPDITLSKGYGNTLDFEMSLDESVAVKTLVLKAQIPTEIAKVASECPTLIDLSTFLQNKSAEQSTAVEAAKTKANALTDPQEQAKALDEANQFAESNAAVQLRNQVSTVKDKGLSKYIWDTFIAELVPQFLYFDEYYQMQGGVNIDQLKTRQANNALEPSDQPMLALIELAGLDLDQLTTPTRTQALINKLEGASNRLSRSFLKYWSQNKHVMMKFDVRPALSDDPPGMQSGTNIWASVYDSIHQVSTLFGKRSKGFVWFFSFLAWFSQQKHSKKSLILLLDEPGLFLHASAQGDLLRYIEEELKPHHQVIYTTHSPFLVDPQHFERVRIVEDRSMSAVEELPLDQQGTRVLSEVLEAGEGSLFPLQGAMGYDLAQTLFVGPNSLIVEGVSDLLYLQTISAVLEADGREYLSRQWTITPVGGAEKVSTFAALIGSQKMMKVATLIDIQKTDRQRIENLYKKKLLHKKHVLTFADFTSQDEADIEDMFGVDFYLRLVNSEFASALSTPIVTADLTAKSPRVLQRIEDFLRGTPLNNGVSFSHYRPARYFAENVGALRSELPITSLDAFEKAFIALNALL